jgi:hypothetical protein
VASTTTISNTLGFKNSPNDSTSGWDYFPFHDRDFTSVTELLLVPGVPPGLFTKQFVELAPDSTQTPPFPVSTATTMPPAAKPATSATTSSMANTTVSTAGTPFPVATGTTPAPPQTYPYLIDNFFYSGATDSVYGRTSDGWHQILEYFEVPPTNFGAIGEVASGANYDWYRQDLRPGQLNLNLIIDEEVFFGLISDGRTADSRLLRATIPTPAAGYPATPQIVTQIDANGQPNYDVPSWAGATPTYVATGSYFMNPTRGYYDAAMAASTLYPHNMKAAFADFLRLRHGGSNFLFAWGSGKIVGTGGTTPATPTFTFPNGMPSTGGAANTGSPMAENPFRSLSNGDITTTVMRPALTLPTHPYAMPAGVTGWVTPGLRDTTTTTTVGYVPQIPPRRLFSLPDKTVISNASETPFGNTTYNTTASVSPIVPLYNPAFNLFADATLGVLGDASLGANTTSPTAADSRQHPYYRTELLSKVMNLTTVRTHQFAVWITVGFFEVVQPGNSQMATVNPLLVPDSLGQEIGSAEGKSVRYRSFFILDRTKATGFNLYNPGDFRDLVVYRSRIE